MKTIPALAACMFILMLAFRCPAQNIFPSSGRAGIYTTSPVTSFQVAGGARIGNSTQWVNIDSATGNLSFGGNAALRVGGNRYAFQLSSNPNYGLYFNQGSTRYEFRDGAALPVFWIDANTGAAAFNAAVRVGGYTLPATDGLNSQVLKTNGAGILAWSDDNNTPVLTAGTGINISSNIISNGAPDQLVTLAGTNGIDVSGTYPSFALNGTGLWGTSGNAGTNTTTNFIGTTDAKDLVFRVNNTEVIRLLNSNKNVGIGTDNPLAKLHIKKASSGTSIVSSNAALLIENGGSVNIQLLSLSSFDRGIYFGDNLNSSDGSIVYSGLSNAFSFRTNNDGLRMTLDSLGNLSTFGRTFKFGSIESFYDSGSNVIACNSDFINQADGILNGLGVSNHRWVDVWAVDGTINTSDAREKNSIRDLDYGLKEILKLRSVRFKWNKGPDKGDRMGVIAQEVQKVLPEAVWDHEYIRDEITGEQKKVPTAVLGINYDAFIPVLIRGMQQQQNIIDEQNKRIEALTKLVEKVVQNQTANATETGEALQSDNPITVAIKLIPNPAKSKVTINGLQKSGVITIIDMQGNQVLRRQVTGNSENINISSLREGAYIVQYLSNGQVQTQKLVKN